MTATVKEENGAGDVKGADAGALTAPEDKIAAQIQVSLEDGHVFYLTDFVTKDLCFYSNSTTFRTTIFEKTSS